MSSDDLCILTTILLALIVALLVVRQTFRGSKTTRDAAITPLVFAVIGGLVGISVGMICLSNTEGRVFIDKGILVLLGGIAVGTVVGIGARRAYSRLRRGKAVVFVLVVMLLGASVGAPMGWIAGAAAGTVYDAQLSASRMMWGIVIGSGVGFLMGLPQLFSRPSVAT